MKTCQRLVLLFAIMAIAAVNAFAPMNSQHGGSFVISQRPSTTSRTAPQQQNQRTGVSSLHMGGKMAKFGIFSPAVYGAKLVLGTEKLNKIRGKAISLHSQYIGEFCEWIGAYHLRTQLIKKAKVNGDTLGFLV
ncbi:hypothetical protein IV203_010494 [Nitzschia inconspicua]|uniref:Uncharacterized protein n=1 Tax=Nitzschia inconspicua TaxID=303405 RepID=A0A9K3PN47_9STRA|nr:hypothetical protein IV203_010494 [Nitzschia inconspicua]